MSGIVDVLRNTLYAFIFVLGVCVQNKATFLLPGSVLDKIGAANANSLSYAPISGFEPTGFGLVFPNKSPSIGYVLS